MIDLDAPAAYSAVDTQQAIERILDLPTQLRAAWSLAQGLRLPDSHRGASSIVICGMGGSAIGGDLVRSLVESTARVPLAIVRGYDLPGYVDSHSLVVLSSYSGSTEETLSAGDQALRVGAKVLGVTTGGVLAQRGAEAGFPVVDFSYLAQPREALGYSVLLILGTLVHLGYAPDASDDVRAAADLLDGMAREIGPSAGTPQNPAKQLAQRLRGKMSVVYGGGLMAEVARRWKGQLNENAKSWAFFEPLPELNHNAIMGYRFPVAMADDMRVVILSCSANHPRVKLREEVTLELLARAGIAAEVVEARGASALEQVLSAVHFGDLVSYYVALLNGADPTEIEAISYLKTRLAAVPSGQNAVRSPNG